MKCGVFPPLYYPKSCSYGDQPRAPAFSGPGSLLVQEGQGSVSVATRTVTVRPHPALLIS